MTDFHRKNIMLLGASGFTGHHLLSLLLKSNTYTVSAPSSQELPLGSKDKFRNYVEKNNPDVIINLAGHAHVLSDDIMQIYQVNAFAVKDMLSVLDETGFKGRFIQASSGNIYGSAYNRIVTEEDLPVPANDYGCSKVLLENFCGLYSDRLDICLTRPFSGIGAGQNERFLVPKIASHFKRKAPVIELGNIDVERDFIDIRDVASAYMTLVECAVLPQKVIISRGQTHSIRDIINKFNEIAGYDIEVSVNPDFIRPNDLLYQCADNKKLFALGWQPQYTFEETIRWIYQS